MTTIISKKALTPGKVIEILEKEKEKRELTYIEEKTLKYLKTFYDLSPKEEERILKELDNLNLPDYLKIQILTFRPKKEEDLKIVLYTYTLKKEDMEKILNIFK